MSAEAIPHLRARDGSEQPTTAVELFFDLVYVFAVTQLSNLLIGDLSWVGAAHAAFLLLVIWWAWIYTTWMVNWFDPNSTRVRMTLMVAMLASLLMAAAIPDAFGGDRLLFAIAYVTLQVGRNVAAMLMLPRGYSLRRTFERIVAWSALSGTLWILGGLGARTQLAFWGTALAIDLAAPFAGYWTPRLGRSRTGDYEIEGGHFAERCQGFIIIALGESIVVTGATATAAGLRVWSRSRSRSPSPRRQRCGGSTSTRSLSAPGATWSSATMPGHSRGTATPTCTYRSSLG